MNPQLFGPVMDQLYAAGALEVFFVPVQMKKSRPGTLVSVLVAPDGQGRDRRRAVPRDDDHRRALCRVAPRVPGARDRAGRDALWRRAHQGRAAPRARS